MPWMKNGDDAATYPKLTATAGLTGADERTVNEVAGWLWRCATHSASHMTDYVVNVGTAQLFGGARTKLLVRMCVKTELMSPCTVRGIKGWRIVDDPEFINIRLRAEVLADRQQRNDTRDPALRVPVLRRDGDICRYCAVLVQWRGRTTHRTGTLDHRLPGEPGTVQTLVVACKRCNSSRQDNPQWDDDHPLHPAPARPLFGPVTAVYLTEHGYPTTSNLTADQQRPAPAPGADPAPDGVRPATAAGDDPAQGATDLGQKSPDKSPGCTDRTTPAGSGQDRSGPGSGPGSGGAGSAAAAPQPGRRRGRRGGRRSGGEV